MTKTSKLWFVSVKTACVWGKVKDRLEEKKQGKLNKEAETG